MRPIDKSKIERIKLNTIRLVVEHGYHNATIALIAKQSGVSEGYLYRYYKNKHELVSRIYENLLMDFHGEISEIYAESETVKDFIEHFINHIVHKTKDTPDRSRFIFFTDHSHYLEIPENALNATRELCGKLLMRGKNTGEIHQELTAEDVYIVLFSIPFRFIEARLKKTIIYKEMHKNDYTHVADICGKALM